MSVSFWEGVRQRWRKEGEIGNHLKQQRTEFNEPTEAEDSEK